MGTEKKPKHKYPPVTAFGLENLNNVEMYLAHANSTEPCDREIVEKALTREYVEFAKVAAPKFVWVRSPREANLIIEQAAEMDDEDTDKLLARIPEILRDPNKQPIYEFDNFLPGNWAMKQRMVLDDRYVNNQEAIDIWNKHEDERIRFGEIYHHTYLYGHLCYRIARFVICVERPLVSKMQYRKMQYRNDNFYYHCEDGPVVAWADGFSYYYLNNFRVPKWLVETPVDDLNASDYLRLKNVETRRQFAWKFGWARLIKDFSMKLIDEWVPNYDEIRYETLDDFNVVSQKALGLEGDKVDSYKLYDVQVPVNAEGRTKNVRGLFMRLSDKHGLIKEYFEFVSGSPSTAKEAYFINRPNLPRDIQQKLT